MPFPTLRIRLLLAAMALTLSARAQVLARPGVVGSNAISEAWWRRAVLYRLDPARFQDSDGDGLGDLQGVAARLDYLQRLGVDGLLLDAAELGHQPEDPAFGELLREASRRGIRLLIALRTSDAGLAGEGRRWLSAGAAGIYLMRPLAEVQGEAAGAKASLDAVRELRQAAASFPAERVLLADPGATDTEANDPAPPADTNDTDEPAHRRRGRYRRHAEAAAPRTPHGSSSRSPVRPQLTGTARLLPPPAAEGTEVSVAGLRSLLGTGATGRSRTTEAEAPLLRLPLTVTAPPTDRRAAALWRTLAVMELALRGPAVVDFGAELGLNTGPDGSAARVLMQWTPGNRTLPPPAPVKPPAESPPVPTPAQNPEVYGSYHPYVRPPKGTAAPAPAPLPGPKSAENAEAPSPAKIDPDTLPGFTTGELPVPPVEGKLLNVAVEDTDPASLLTFYRKLIALHHDNPALEKGSMDLLNAGDGVLAWVRRAPAGSRTAGGVVVVCNLGTAGVSLNLRDELRRVGVAPGGVRELVSSGGIGAQTVDKLALPGYAVFVGEIVR